MGVIDVAEVGPPAGRYDDIGLSNAYDPANIAPFVEQYVRLSAERLEDLDVESMGLVLLLIRAAKLVQHDLESNAQRPHGLSSAAFYVAAIVWLAGPLESSKVATIAGMSRSAVSALTNTLVRDDWIARDHSTTDARSVRLSLTEEGRRRIQDVFHAVNGREQMWAARLGQDEIHELTRLLAKLINAPSAE